jgi:hypothetical protein
LSANNSQHARYYDNYDAGDCAFALLFSPHILTLPVSLLVGEQHWFGILSEIVIARRN